MSPRLTDNKVYLVFNKYIHFELIQYRKFSFQKYKVTTFSQLKPNEDSDNIKISIS
jgi:hypothetical protein